MNYLIHSGLLLAACYLYYQFMLRRETHFRLNRYVLLGSMVACLALPLITVPATLSMRHSPIMVDIPTPVSVPVISTSFDPLPRTVVSESAKADATVEPMKILVAPTNWFTVLQTVYFGGVGVFFLHFLLQLILLVRKIGRNPCYDIDGLRVVELEENDAPYSFLNYVFLNPGKYDVATYRSILDHERVHVEQRHSIDLLLAELLIVVQWCNPFAWLYRRSVDNNLEYLTDAEILRSGTDAEGYQFNLLRVAVPGQPHGLVTHYNQNFLEQRIMMMKAKPSSARSGWKYFALPALLLCSLSSFNAVASTSVETVSLSPAAPALPPPPPAAPPLPPAPPPLPPAVFDAPNVMAEAAFNKTRRSWTAEIDGNEVCMALIETSDRGNYNMNSNHCFATSDLGSLPRGTMGDFSLTRTAGTLSFRGIFEGNTGLGTYEFKAATAYTTALEKSGFGTFDDRELLHFLLTDITLEYLAFLKKEYNPSHDELVQVAIFGIDRATLKQVSYDLKKAGFGEPGLEKIVQLRIFGIDNTYFADLAGAGFTDLTLDNVIAAKIHGIDANFVRQMASLGFEDLSFDEIVNLAIHGIDAEYAKEMASLGYEDLSAESIVNAKIHGVNARKAKEMQDLGLAFDGIRDLQDFSIHGVTAELVKGLRDMGYTELGVRDFIDARIHGVTPDFVASYADLGYGKIPFRTLIDLRIHGVTPDFVEKNRREGDELRDLIDYKIVKQSRR